MQQYVVLQSFWLYLLSHLWTDFDAHRKQKKICNLLPPAWFLSFNSIWRLYTQAYFWCEYFMLIQWHSPFDLQISAFRHNAHNTFSCVLACYVFAKLSIAPWLMQAFYIIYITMNLCISLLLARYLATTHNSVMRALVVCMWVCVCAEFHCRYL